MAEGKELAQSAEQLDDLEWYAFLDELDEVTRRRRERGAAPGEPPEPPPGADRDTVAAWIMRQHLILDPSIREVWHLPGGAEANELRLVEVSEQFGPAELPASPLPLADRVAETPFRLLVVDVDGAGLEALRTDPGLLPPGWTFEGAACTRRKP